MRKCGKDLGWRGAGGGGEDKDYKIEYYIAETAMENVTNDTNTFNFPSVRPPPARFTPEQRLLGSYTGKWVKFG